MGETHLAIATERLARKFGVEVETEDVIVAYRETITRQGRGRGQVQEADRRPRPVRRRLPPGRAARARRRVRLRPTQIVGGAIPRQFIPAVQKGIEETMATAGVFGYPVVDVKVTCFDGKYHPVDSSEMSFKMAGSLGFKEAMAKAGPVLLEPVSLLEVTVPGRLPGRRHGRPQLPPGPGPGHRDGQRRRVSVVVAMVPTSEILRYAIDLRSLTGGRGRFSVEHDHYDPLPPTPLGQGQADTAGLSRLRRTQPA